MKYHRLALFAAISCLLLSAVFIAPYLTAFHEQEKIFEYADLTVTAPQPQRTGNQIGGGRAAVPAFLLRVRQFVHRRQYRQSHQGAAG